ncbi:MAG: SGNH/GDSL hydrolase family protein [Anaerolineae bacterium]|nr:SGNH/GDSL hydrolase family protein [Anaerolineae bacterium]MDK1079994.1 SGNH/GDSL hydrolase family protein [Anaerolineae bacterium]
MKYLYFLLIIVLIGCAPGATQEIEKILVNTAVPTESPENTIRFLALGDSYTIGQNVPEKERWPEILSGKLKEHGIDSETTIVAQTGWTTKTLASLLLDKPPEDPPYELVSLLIGVNDQFRGGNTDDYRTSFRKLLAISITLAGDDPQKVIVVSIPDWEVTPYAKNSGSSRSFNIDDFNQVNLQEAQDYGVRYVDITSISREAETDLSLLALDKLHPSGVMYALWVDEMLPQILEMVGE